MKKICGVDEVGRGPWAGPVIAAAVILPAHHAHIDLRDSKKMSAKSRRIADEAIRHSSVYAYGAASVREIDIMNIREAALLAMRRAVMNLPYTPTHIDIDGNAIPKELPCPAEAIVKGDATHPHIAAASIIAKTLRDRLMTKLCVRYPQYAWSKNAGYGTKIHQEGLNISGITPHHRKSFKPIARLI